MPKTCKTSASLTRLFKQTITYVVLASLQLGTLVQTKEAYAQYVQFGGQPTNGQTNPYIYTPPASASSGYTPDGTLFMGGQRIGNPHQILHDAQIPAFMTITANRYTYTDNPNHGQGTLAQMELATTNGSDSSVLLNRMYLSPTNPYVQGAPGPYPNYQTYQGVLQNAQQANYLLTNANDGKTYAFKTLTAANRQAVDLLIRELPNTSQFQAASDPIGGGVGVRVTTNGDAAAQAAYFATVKPYDYSWQPNFGTAFGQNGGQNPAFSGWANSNNFTPTYGEGNAAQDSHAAFIRQMQDDAVANDKRIRAQTTANSLDLSNTNPNSLFGNGYDLFQYGSNSNPNRDLENDFLRRLQSGQLTVGSADYLEARRIAQERYRIAYATRLETGKPQPSSVAGEVSNTGEGNAAIWIKTPDGKITLKINPAAGQSLGTNLGKSPAGAPMVAGKPGEGTFYTPGAIPGTGMITIDPTWPPEQVAAVISHEDKHHIQNIEGRLSITKRPGETDRDFVNRYTEERKRLEGEAVLAQGLVNLDSLDAESKKVVEAYQAGLITHEETVSQLAQIIGTSEPSNAPGSTYNDELRKQALERIEAEKQENDKTATEEPDDELTRDSVDF